MPSRQILAIPIWLSSLPLPLPPSRHISTTRVWTAQPSSLAQPRHVPRRQFSQSAHRCSPRHDDSRGGNHYQILGVPREATPADVKKAFYAQSKKSHPDHNPGDPTAAQRFARISEAYSVLGTPAKRAKYDLTLANNVSAASSSRQAPHGSYHSTGPAGGRPASGLSRRRTRFYGPPPSYTQSPHIRQHRDAGSTTGSHRGAAAYGGLGPGQEPYARPLRPEETPHFDKESHYRTHSVEDKRRAGRQRARIHEHRVNLGPQPSDRVNFVLISSVIGLALLVPAIWHAMSQDSRSRKEQLRGVNRSSVR